MVFSSAGVARVMTSEAAYVLPPRRAVWIPANVEHAASVLERLRIAHAATSLGGPETLVCHPATTTHASLTDDELTASGIGPGLLRVSVGLEDPDDLIADFLHAVRTEH